MIETELAYFAGIVDADGHIGIDRSRTMPQRRLSPRYQGQLNVVNTSKALMDWILARFGGSVRLRRQEKEHHKRTYSWKVSDHGAVTALRQIEPYLRIKRPQALLVIELFEGRLPMESRVRAVGAQARLQLSDAEVRRRADVYERLRMVIDDRRPQRLSGTASRTDEAIV